tara:strand:+ start:5232 stop:6983 length:1752 start_codon:yes stop_codon:yes gene_type:complete
MSRPSRVVLPVLDLEQNDKPLVKKVVKGCKNYTQHRISSDSNSNQSCSFSFQPPSQNSIVDRKFILKANISVKLAGVGALWENVATSVSTPDSAPDVGQNYRIPMSSQRISQVDAEARAADVAKPVQDFTDYAGGALLKIGNNLAPRQFPLASIIDTIDLTINGTHFTASINQYIHAVMEYTTVDYRNRVLSQVAHHPDKNNYAGTLGKAVHPLNLNHEAGRGAEQPRGTLLDECSGNNTNTLTFVLEEPLFLSPLMAEFGHGMSNVNDVSVQINWSSKLENFLSCAIYPAATQTARTFPVNATTLAAATTIIEKTELNVRYYTAQDDIKIPNEIVLPYKQPKIVIKESGQHNKGTATPATGNNIRLNQVPECVFVYAKAKRSAKTPESADISARISKIEVDWNNQSGALSALTEKDLVRLSVENGLDEASNEYLTNGLVVKLVFGKDLPLPDNVSAGTRGDWSIQITPTISASAETDIYEVFNVFFYNGHAIISPNECKVSTGLLDLKDNVEAEDMGHEYHGEEMSGGSSVGGSMVGGSLVGGKMNHLVRRVLKDAGKGVMRDFAPKALDGAKAYIDYKTRA